MLNGQWKAAKQLKEKKVTSQETVMDDLRSAALLLADGCKDVLKLYQVYWQSGTCFEDKKMIRQVFSV
jgi:hypothetical protein